MMSRNIWIKRAYKCGALCDAQKLYDLRAYLDGPKRQPTLHEKPELYIDPTLHVTRFFAFKEGDVSEKVGVDQIEYQNQIRRIAKCVYDRNTKTKA